MFLDCEVARLYWVEINKSKKECKNRYLLSIDNRGQAWIACYWFRNQSRGRKEKKRKEKERKGKIRKEPRSDYAVIVPAIPFDLVVEIRDFAPHQWPETRRQYWNTRLEDRRKMPCACRQGRIAIHRSTYWSMVTQAWIPKCMLGQSRGCMATIRPRCTRLASWKSVSRQRRFESIRINRREKDDHWRRVPSSLRIFDRSSSERATRSLSIFLDLSVLRCTRCPGRQTHVFLVPPEAFAPKRESIVSRVSKLWMIGIREDLRRNINESKQKFQCSRALEENFKLTGSECSSEIYETMRKHVISATPLSTIISIALCFIRE